MKIIFFGTPDFVLPILKMLQEDHDVIGVITAPDQIAGRKKILTPTPVKQFALETGILHILTPDKLTTEFTDELHSLEADIFIVAAYGKIIPDAILSLPKYGALNIHPSLLPRYRGPSPIQTALLHGDKQTGITIIKMDAKMDHGPIVAQKVINLKPTDTFASLHKSLFEDAATMLQTTLDEYISGDILPVEQSHETATFCKMITREHGYIDSTTPPSHDVIDRMIRAYYPWPTAWTKVTLNNGETKILKLLPDNHVQLEGKTPTTMKDLSNGYPELEEILVNLGFTRD